MGRRAYDTRLWSPGTFKATEGTKEAKSTKSSNIFNPFFVAHDQRDIHTADSLRIALRSTELSKLSDAIGEELSTADRDFESLPKYQRRERGPAATKLQNLKANVATQWRTNGSALLSRDEWLVLQSQTGTRFSSPSAQVLNMACTAIEYIDAGPQVCMSEEAHFRLADFLFTLATVSPEIQFSYAYKILTSKSLMQTDGNLTTSRLTEYDRRLLAALTSLADDYEAELQAAASFKEAEVTDSK